MSDETSKSGGQDTGAARQDTGAAHQDTEAARQDTGAASQDMETARQDMETARQDIEDAEPPRERVDEDGLPLDREATIDDVRSKEGQHGRIAMGCTLAIVLVLVLFWLIRGGVIG